ncbi:MAG: CpaF family protein [Thermaerobacter sp.]|jgi:pilus assembly protein CpaF|nr:CpaF family protein [Thermaerobacter sp.]
MSTSLYNRLRTKEMISPERTGSTRSFTGEEKREGLAHDKYREVKNRIQLKLVEEMDSKTFLYSRQIPEEDKQRIRAKINELLRQESDVPPLDRAGVAESLFTEITGYGPIQPLLDDPEITEVMVNNPRQVYVERRGKIEPTDVSFRDDAQVFQLIEKIVTPIGRHIDESSPMVDARLPDGSRVNAVIPPLALKGPCITIRKFAKDPYHMDDLVSFGTVNQKIALFLSAAVRAKLNVLISGGTGTGKTTFLNVLSSYIPEDERIVTIEDAAELQLQQDHVVPMEVRPPNLEGQGEINIRQLVKNSLRMRPDRIIVGEVRTGEALDMLQAMNTGHDGCMTTVHANSPRDALSRLETMVMMAGMELPSRAIREQVAAALDLVVQLSRLKDGTRKVVNVSEIQGMEGDVIVMQDIFKFHTTGMDGKGYVTGEFQGAGIRPRVYQKMQDAGTDLPPDVFSAA